MITNTIPVTDDLEIETRAALGRHSAPVIVVHNLKHTTDGQPNQITIRLADVRSLIAALTDAAVGLAEQETRERGRRG